MKCLHLSRLSELTKNSFQLVHGVPITLFSSPVPTGAPRDVRIRAASPTSLLIEWAVRAVPVNAWLL